MVVAPGRAPELVALDDALDALAGNDDRAAKVVELHYFGGLTYAEISETLSISEATVDRDLRFATGVLGIGQKVHAHQQLVGGIVLPEPVQEPGPEW